jgi:hypothetical protein
LGCASVNFGAAKGQLFDWFKSFNNWIAPFNGSSVQGSDAPVKAGKVL